MVTCLRICGLFFVCLLFLLTCELARRLSVPSPPLQDEEVVAPLGHPQLQSVFQQHFLRGQPHFFQQGGTGGRPPPPRSLPPPPRCVKSSGSGPGLADPTGAGRRLEP